LAVEYLNEDGAWMSLIEPASTIEGPIVHAWDLPPEAVHEWFALRITVHTTGTDPIYVSSLSIASRCLADFDDSGFVDIDDFTEFVSAFEVGSPSSDVDGSGFVDTDDFTYFILAFNAGC
ncbi:MAG TPA: EF-hand domain-containing protein, partial [Phycisphaerales bacterium]|nr:EF-hand domain-containing protein [Phycisphaerales bacterium]